MRSNKGIKQTQHWINSRIATAGSKEAKKYGKAKTDEEKKHLSENSPKYWKGKNRGEETKRKISITKKKNGLSEKTKLAICKKVGKYDSISHKLIMIYESITSASKNNIESQSTISRKCSGKSNSNKIYYFKFL